MDELSRLAILHGTDKIGSHTYTPIYFAYFSHLRNEKFRLLEIGFGGWSKARGYNEPTLGGESARMWCEFFPNAEVTVVDIVPKIVFDEPFIFKQGDQADKEFLTSLGSFKICIDDGSHRSEDQITTFETLFPLMPEGGIYVIEDCQTSYWKELSPGRTAMQYFQERTDGLNYNEIRTKAKGDYFDKNIFSIHFYHNLIFIFKGDNTEPSNSHD
jgi:hypothetical protein